jgi:hypothetical protein
VAQRSPGLDEAEAGAQRGTFDVVMALAIDRVGRLVVDVLETSAVAIASSRLRLAIARWYR